MLRKKSGKQFHLQWLKKNQNLGINISKELKGLCSEHYKTQKKDIK
jgi:hypothetical protein